MYLCLDTDLSTYTILNTRYTLKYWTGDVMLRIYQVGVRSNMNQIPASRSGKYRHFF